MFGGWNKKKQIQSSAGELWVSFIVFINKALYLAKNYGWLLSFMVLTTLTRNKNLLIKVGTSRNFYERTFSDEGTDDAGGILPIVSFILCSCFYATT